MASDSDDSVFITQNTFKPSNDTESEEEVSIFRLESDLLSEATELDLDGSDNELLEATLQTEKRDVEEKKTPRFLPPVAESDLDILVKTSIPKSTENKTKWAVTLFENWCNQRNQIGSNSETIEIFEEDILDMSKGRLNKALAYFISEVKNQKGYDYYPNTLYELVISIQKHLRLNGENVSFLDDDEFTYMKQVLDAKMKELSRQGLGSSKKKADVISTEREQVMWERNILGTDTPKKLVNTLLYCIGLNFALRAGQEHRHLRVGTHSQLAIKMSDSKEYLEYREDVSKTNSGGIKDRKVGQKIVRAYGNEDPQRCLLTIYRKYMSLRPKDGKCDALYLRPKRYPTTNTWYDDAPIGVHLLQKTVSDLCNQAGFKGFFTNHSLRATAATRLFEAGVDEQLISEKTGHRSTAVREYKRTSEVQLQHVNDVIQVKQAKLTETAKKEEQDDQEGPKSRAISIQAGDISINLKF